MAASWTGRAFGRMLWAAVVCGAGFHTAGAQAYGAHRSGHAAYSGHFSVSRWHGGYGRYAGRSYTALRHWASSGLQCVPFARENSGIELSGNAATWWDKADGLYQRGARPEVGSILNFRSTGSMRMGHVAVVTNVVDGRHIQIDHANWASPGRISRDMDVVDVSPSNDWTAVRVELDQTSEFGSVYPTYGFIYDRPDDGTMLANNGRTAAPLLNAPPADLRDASVRLAQPLAPTAPEEVAEAADDGDDLMSDSPRASHRWSRYHGHGSARHLYSMARFAPHGAKSAGFYRVANHGGAPLATGWHHHHRA